MEIIQVEHFAKYLADSRCSINIEIAVMIISSPDLFSFHPTSYCPEIAEGIHGMLRSDLGQSWYRYHEITHTHSETHLKYGLVS